MEKVLIIGLDLSFNSTGICSLLLENDIPQTIAFDRVVFETHPRPVRNINTITYSMPSNITLEDLQLCTEGKNYQEQIETTLRSLICAKGIIQIIKKHIDANIVGLTGIIFSIENYVMPSFGGPNSLKSVSGLIALQSYIRRNVIEWKLQFDNKFVKLFTPTPTQNKKFFTGDGKADKNKMMQVFIDLYNGKQLLPDLGRGKLDDIIDSFSLVAHALYEFRNNRK